MRAMQYYDRQIHPDLLALAKPGSPLAWLVEWVLAEPTARIDFRRQDNGARDGALKLYLGRTSPLELIWTRQGQIKLTAHDKYKAVSPGIFASHTPAELQALQGALRAHLEACKVRAGVSFTEGEAVAHNGLMRRYGLRYEVGDPLLAVDSEAVIGFRSDPARGLASGSAARAAHQAAARVAVGLPKGQQQPKKLDTIGVLPNGDIALVEVKDKGGDLVRAAWQVAVHAYNFSTLMAQEDRGLVEVIEGMIAQKVALGLIPPVKHPRVAPKLIPIIAAPDDDPAWASRWVAGLEGITPPYLEGLRLWRLSKDGVIEAEQARP